jgi:hypothetical protein
MLDRLVGRDEAPDRMTDERHRARIRLLEHVVERGGHALQREVAQRVVAVARQLDHDDAMPVREQPRGRQPVLGPAAEAMNEHDDRAAAERSRAQRGAWPSPGRRVRPSATSSMTAPSNTVMGRRCRMASAATEQGSRSYRKHGLAG